ncbi:hypothetical protein LRY60_03325 [Candidatus Woesebacteria bacterium]|nr:hypothetical protein [Candidatus Woesebacteria bacterium]
MRSILLKVLKLKKTESSFSERDWEDLLKRLNEVIKVKVWEIVATYISAIDPEKTNYQEARDFILEKFVSIPFVKDTLEANKHEIYETDDRTYDRFYFVVNLFYQETYGIDLKPRLDTEMDSRSKAYNLLREMLGALHHQKKEKLIENRSNGGEDFWDDFITQLQSTTSAQLDLSLEEFLMIDNSLNS